MSPPLWATSLILLKSLALMAAETESSLAARLMAIFRRRNQVAAKEEQDWADGGNPHVGKQMAKEDVS
jgi:hypothetical protein